MFNRIQFIVHAGAALLIAGLIFCPPAARAEKTADRPGSRTITILHTNDSHGRYMPFEATPGNATSQTGDHGRPYLEFERAGTVGGMARLATAVDRVRTERGPERVILVHAGDAFGDDLLGNLTRGEAVIQLMNAIGCQFMALGNHDFDYGLERTRELQGIARFPMRGANILVEATGEAVLGDPALVVDAAGVRVGLLALGYHNTRDTTNPKNVEGLRFTSGIDAAKRYVPELRKRADVVVVLSHQGSKVDEVLAGEVEGIDLIIGGHSHDLMAQKNGKTPIFQSLSDGAALGEVRLTVENGGLTSIEGSHHILWSDRLEPDKRIEQMIETLRAPHRKQLQETLATALEPIGRQYKSESPFDRLAADILREDTKADIAMLPGVGYGITLQPGPITREALYTLLPHPSEVVTLDLHGSQILAILEQSGANLKPRDPLDAVGGLIQTSGMRWTIDLTKPEGQRIGNVRVGLEPLQPDRIYRVATHEGMLSGTHRYSVFARGGDVRKLNRKLVDLVEERIRAMGQVPSPTMGHVTLIRE